MSDPHDPAHPADLSHEGAHEGPIKTPKQLIAAVVASFVVPIIAILLLVNFVDFGNRTGAGGDGLTAKSIAQRLQPVGTVEVRDANAPAVVHSGEQVYTGQCAACHAAGAAGAPKLGDSAAWAARIKLGYEALLTAALKGKGAMPPQGGGDYADFEIGRGVVYMTNQAGASFAEPPAPAASAASAADGAGNMAAAAAAPAASGAEGANGAASQPK